MPNSQASFSVDNLSVQIYDSEAKMAQDVAQRVQDYLQNTINTKGAAFVLLATGNSQLKFLDALINLGGVNWSQITCFHLDEYLGIAANHPGSFRCYLYEKVDSRVQVKQFNYIEGDALEPLAECQRYTQLLQAQPIDLCCLGVGENGHLAFNDPAVADFEDINTVKLVKLDDVNRQQQVNTGYFSKLESVPQYGFTVTIPVICAAKKVICLAPGQGKAKVIKAMLQGEVSQICPASILRKLSQATLFLDNEAVSLIL